MLPVHVGFLGEPALLLAGNQYRRKKPFCVIVERLPPSAIINGGPGNDRPAVVQLPVDCPHAAPPVSPEMLHPIADGICLQKLGGVQDILEAGGITVGLLEIIHDLSVCAVIPLVLFHDIGKNIPVPGIVGKGLDGLFAREGLKAELRRIAEIVLPVLGKGLVSVPHFPVMHISPVRIVGVVEGPAGGRARRPVKGLRIMDFQDSGNDPLIHQEIIPHLRGLRHPAPLIHKHFHLVVAAPQRQAGVVPDPLHIVGKLPGDIFLKFRRQLVHRTCEHEILPDGQPQLIANVVEPVVRIEAAAPDTDHIEVGQLTVLQKPAGLLRASSPQEMLLRNVVRAHGKKWFSVDDMCKALAPGVFFPLHGHAAQADPPRPGIRLYAAAK